MPGSQYWQHHEENKEDEYLQYEEDSILGSAEITINTQPLLRPP